MQRKRLNNKMIFQQDGVLSYFSNEVRTWFNETFNEKWIGSSGLVSYAPRSPGLTPLNFFLWRYIKTKVDKTKINDIGDI